MGQQTGIYEADLESTRVAWNLLKPSISMMGVPHGRNRGSLNVELNMHLVKKLKEGASLVAQWLRICLPMQGTQVRALVWEDPTCRGATRPVSHNY